MTATAEGASITIQRRIEWSDTDASGRWHNTAVLRLFEAAETALLDRLGLLGDIYGRLPRVAVNASFLLPLELRERVDVELQVSSLGRTSITYRATISRGGEVAARGELTAVLTDGAGTPVEWSSEQRAALAGAGPQSPELLTEGS